MKELENIKSVCPSCYQQGLIEKIDAKIVEEKGKVWIIKKCKKHGSFKDIYFGDYKIYKLIKKINETSFDFQEDKDGLVTYSFKHIVEIKKE